MEDFFNEVCVHQTFREFASEKGCLGLLEVAIDVIDLEFKEIIHVSGFRYKEQRICKNGEIETVYFNFRPKLPSNRVVYNKQLERQFRGLPRMYKTDKPVVRFEAKIVTNLSLYDLRKLNSTFFNGFQQMILMNSSEDIKPPEFIRTFSLACSGINRESALASLPRHFRNQYLEYFEMQKLQILKPYTEKLFWRAAWNCYLSRMGL